MRFRRFQLGLQRGRQCGGLGGGFGLGVVHGLCHLGLRHGACLGDGGIERGNGVISLFLGLTGSGKVGGNNRGAVFQHLANLRQPPARQQQIQHHEDNRHPAHLIQGERIVEIHLRHGIRESRGGRQGQQDCGAKPTHQVNRMTSAMTSA